MSSPPLLPPGYKTKSPRNPRQGVRISLSTQRGKADTAEKARLHPKAKEVLQIK